MTDYTKTTDFEAKDSLPSGDTNKVVRGSEFEVEFDNIATAIATKANKASPTFTGTATIPTASITTLNLGGVAVTSTASELNILDGVTATAAELNILDGVTATATELNILDGVTATTAELNILDGVTATTIEINLLDGVTATTSELNILDGVTATTTELNYVDGVTSNIQTQLNTKAPTASPTFTGTPAAPTAVTTTNTTQIATTAFVQAVKAALYPVGSIYTNATDSTNPATLLGFGTWSRFGEGRVLVSQDSTNTLFDTAEETGGSYDAVNVSHTHTITDPGHVHSLPIRANSGSGTYAEDASSTGVVSADTGSSTTGITINSAGVSGTNKNIQPYITVYMWKRTA